MYPQLAMTGPVLHEDFSVVRESVTHNLNHASFYSWCTNSRHPIAQAAGLRDGMFLLLMFAGETDMNWGRPSAASADVIAISVGAPGHAAAFVYEQGALMYGDVAAPARRAGIFLGDDSFRLLSYAEGPAALDPKQKTWFGGRPLFEATVRWAIDAPVRQELGTADLPDALAARAHNKRVLFLRRENLPWPEGERSRCGAYRIPARARIRLLTPWTRPPRRETLDAYDLIVISGHHQQVQIRQEVCGSGPPRNSPGGKKRGRHEHGRAPPLDRLWHQRRQAKPLSRRSLREGRASVPCTMAAGLASGRSPGCMNSRDSSRGAFLHPARLIVATIPEPAPERGDIRLRKGRCDGQRCRCPRETRPVSGRLRPLPPFERRRIVALSRRAVMEPRRVGLPVPA